MTKSANSGDRPTSGTGRGQAAYPAAQKSPHRRNQLLATALVGVIASLFIIVVGLVILLHYGQSHHLFATL